jgi:hypothetical protein
MTTLPPIVYITSGFAPKSARPEEGGQRDLTTDTTGVFLDFSEDHRHHGVFGESSLATSLLVSIGLAPNLSVTTQRIPYPEGGCRGRLGRRPLVGYLN